MAQPYASPCDAALIDAEACPDKMGRAAPPAQRRWVLAACILASSMAFIDGSALTVALPAMREDLNADLVAIQWVLNAYVLALAALTLIGGALADVFGKARMTALGCLLFGAASAACALAPDVGWLIAARVGQGVAAAILTPASLALIGATYPKSQRGAAIGAWASASALTTMGGPILGGWLTETFGWQAVFWINPPVAALAIGVLAKAAPADYREPRRFDLVGAGVIATALALGAFALSQLGEGAASATTLAAAAGAVVGLGVYIGWELRTEHPMTPPHLFANRPFRDLNAATFVLYAALSAMFFLLPFHLIEDRGLSATQAGLVFLPFTLAVGLLSGVFGGLAEKVGAKRMMSLGAGGGAVAYAAMAFGLNADLALGVLAPMTLLGVSFAMIVAPLTATVMSSVGEAEEGLASGVNNAASRIAQLVGVAAAAAFAVQAGGQQAGLAVAAAGSALGALMIALGAPTGSNQAETA